MKLKECYAENFGSYKSFRFNFEDQGLALLYGPTGAGKSTICDIPYWILFGLTAKNGSVDDVRSWTSDNETKGELLIETPSGDVHIVRVRGNAKQNDLYWIKEGKKIRGKDLADTQKLLEVYLNITPTTYLLGSYFNEYTPAASFFTAKAKDRREILENLVDLSFPTVIAEKSVEARKQKKQEIQKAQTVYDRADGRLSQLKESLQSIKKYKVEWERKQNELIEKLIVENINFLTIKEQKLEKEQILFDLYEKQRREKQAKLLKAHATIMKDIEKSYTLGEPCETCGRRDNSDDLTNHLDRKARTENQIQQVLLEKNPHLDKIDQINKEPNLCLEKLEEAKNQINPYIEQFNNVADKVNDALSLLESSDKGLNKLINEFDALVQLQDLALELRGKLIKQTVSILEDLTNNYLETYFDSEFKIAITQSDGDGLDVTITKNGYYCVFKQLSKGQKALLKLCFSVASMEVVSQQSGVHFDSLFFDEALDGLDSNLKIKAFTLFEALQKNHKCLILIDHATEFQQLFNNRWRVDLNGDNSELYHEE